MLLFVLLLSVNEYVRAEGRVHLQTATLATRRTQIARREDPHRKLVKNENFPCNQAQRSYPRVVSDSKLRENQ